MLGQSVYRSIVLAASVVCALLVVVDPVRGQVGAAGLQGDLGLEILGGITAAAAPVAVTTLVLCGGASVVLWRPCGWSLVHGSVLIGSFGSIVTVPFGVYAGGRLSGGAGDFWVTAIGAAVPTFAGLLAADTMNVSTSNLLGVTSAIIAAELVFSTLAYRVSGAMSVRAHPSSSGLQMVMNWTR
jgi:hypothetical protein